MEGETRGIHLDIVRGGVSGLAKVPAGESSAAVQKGMKKKGNKKEAPRCVVVPFA